MLTMKIGNPLPVFLGITLMACFCGYLSRHLAVLDEVLDRVAKAVEVVVSRGVSAAMNEFNRRDSLGS